MILTHKRFVKLELLLSSCMVIVITCIAVVSPDQEYWFANAFFDKIFLFVFLPLYLVGNYWIDSSVAAVQMIRIRTRRRVMLYLLGQKIIHIVVFVSTWFVMVMLGTILRFQVSNGIDFYFVAELYVRWMLEVLLVANGITLLRWNQRKLVREYAYIIIYCMVLVEITAVTELNAVIPSNVYFIFSWICSKYRFSNIVLLIMNVILVLYLQRKVSRNDIWE